MKYKHRKAVLVLTRAVIILVLTYGISYTTDAQEPTPGPGGCKVMIFGDPFICPSDEEDYTAKSFDLTGAMNELGGAVCTWESIIVPPGFSFSSAGAKATVTTTEDVEINQILEAKATCTGPGTRECSKMLFTQVVDECKIKICLTAVTGKGGTSNISKIENQDFQEDLLEQLNDTLDQCNISVEIEVVKSAPVSDDVFEDDGTLNSKNSNKLLKELEKEGLPDSSECVNFVFVKGLKDKKGRIVNGLNLGKKKPLLISDKAFVSAVLTPHVMAHEFVHNCGHKGLTDSSFDPGDVGSMNVSFKIEDMLMNEDINLLNFDDLISDFECFDLRTWCFKLNKSQSK
ncbi:MAG: hypothetical protein RIG61_03855 [Deltaproteobacteria bacterium]